MARRSGYTLIKVSRGVTANGNRSALTSLRIAAHRCTRIESLPSPPQMIENCALNLYDFGSTTSPTSEGGIPCPLYLLVFGTRPGVR
jgi:hypothetical protein